VAHYLANQAGSKTRGALAGAAETGLCAPGDERTQQIRVSKRAGIPKAVAAHDHHQKDAGFRGQLEMHDIPNRHTVSPMALCRATGGGIGLPRLEREWVFV